MMPWENNLNQKGGYRMSTRCRIALEDELTGVYSIYCHYDGYPSGVGRILDRYYKDKNTVEKLINLGDISVLGKIPKNNPRLWDSSNLSGSPNLSRACKIYRDRVQKLNINSENGPSYTAKFDINLDQLQETAKKTDASYIYLFTNENEWLVTKCPGQYEPLKDVLRKNKFN